jgi:hypothetical protein
MAVTGLPDYRPPIEQSLRCVCGLRYVVFTGAPFPFNEAAFEASRERAEVLSARFIDARETPWLIRSCGDILMLVEAVETDQSPNDPIAKLDKL